MLLLGLDISSQCTGWALFDDLQLKSHGGIDINKYKNKDKTIDNHTLFNFGLEIESLLFKLQPDEVAVENVYVGINSGVGIKLGMMSGIARFIAVREVGKQVQTIYPAEVNRYFKMKTFGLKSAQRKSLLVINVNKQFKLKLLKKEHDMADAIGLAAVAAKKTFKNLKKKYI